jgi:hypothetical protein
MMRRRRKIIRRFYRCGPPAATPTKPINRNKRMMGTQYLYWMPRNNYSSGQ